jgi:hypothetical protein
MKRNLVTSFVYLLGGLSFGVFYREFTKWNGFVGKTSLAACHPHLIALGMLLFLALYFGLKDEPILRSWKFKTFFIAYNIGLPGTVILMLVRGILQVKAVTLSSGIDGMIQGVAGLFHITLAVGIVFLFLALFERQKSLQKAPKAD